MKQNGRLCLPHPTLLTEQGFLLRRRRILLNGTPAAYYLNTATPPAWLYFFHVIGLKFNGCVSNTVAEFEKLKLNH